MSSRTSGVPNPKLIVTRSKRQGNECEHEQSMAGMRHATRVCGMHEHASTGSSDGSAEYPAGQRRGVAAAFRGCLFRFRTCVGARTSPPAGCKWLARFQGKVQANDKHTKSHSHTSVKITVPFAKERVATRPLPRPSKAAVLVQ